jgi:hypothetical protein
MKRNTLKTLSTSLTFALAVAFALKGSAQQITGTTGSPVATTTIDGKQITIVFDFQLDSAAPGSGGTGRLIVDGKEVDKKRIENGTPIMFPEDETFDVGMDTRSGVARIEHRYESPFEFTGTINKLTFDLGPYQFDPSKSK